MEGSTYAPAPQKFEAGVPNGRPGGRSRGRRRCLERHRHRPDPRPRGAPRRAAARRARRPAVGARRRPARPASAPRGGGGVRRRRACTPTTSARSSTTPASPSGSGTTAPGRCTARSALRRRPARRSPSYNTVDDVDALLEALDRVPVVFGLDLERRGQLMDLYQELILEHSKRPHHAGLREPFDSEVHHINPTCGDEVTLRVDVTGQGSEASCATSPYDAQGCSISVASTLGARRGGHRPHRGRGARDLRGDARHAHLARPDRRRRGGPRRRCRPHRRRRGTRRASSARCSAGPPSPTPWPAPGSTSAHRQHPAAGSARPTASTQGVNS